MSPLADRCTSDARGEFKFNAADDSLLEARHPAHGVGRARLDGAAAVSHRLTIKLAKGAGDAALGAGAITGVVVDDKGAPVPSALVRCRHAGGDGEELAPRAEARAGDDGRFSLGGLDPGLHDVWVVCEGCASAHARVPTGSEVTLKIAAGGSIVGRVVSAEDGEAVPAFTVLVSRPRGVAETVVDESTVVDAEGRFEVRGLEPGEYKVRATAHGFAPSPPQGASVGAEDPAELTLRLTRGATIFGRVTERGSGKPLGWARITVEGGVGDGSSAVPLSVTTVTDDHGEFELGGVAPGLRSVLAAAFGHHMSMVSGLRVEEGARLGPLAFQLNPTREGEEPKLELFGIGVKLRAEGDALIVDGVVPGGGGELAGLVAGDGIVKIDGQLVTELGFQDAIQRIRGPAGSRVMLAVRRPNEGGNVMDLSAERRPIQY
jgi:protocatechuate 3,4-dioxygenase beta subunit